MKNQLLWLFIVISCSLLSAQQEFYGNADLIETQGIKAKALELARYRAVRKAAEHKGVTVESESSVKDMAIEYDRLVIKTKTVVEEIREIYADWDRGDRSRVLVIIQVKGDASSWQPTLRRKLLKGIDNVVLDINKSQTVLQHNTKVQIGGIMHKSTGSYGPFYAELLKMLEDAIQNNPTLKLVRTRGIEIAGRSSHHSIEGTYEKKGKDIDVALKWKAPNQKTLKNFHIMVRPRPQEKLPALTSPNSKTAAKAKKALADNSPGRFHLTMTTDRGKDGAVYRHGENLMLEIKATRDCYLHIYYLQADNKIIQLFPNKYHKSGNRIMAGKIYRIPDHNYEFDFNINCDEASGEEIIKAIASENSLPIVPGKEIFAKMRGIEVAPKKMMGFYKKDNKRVEATCTILTVK